MKISKFIFLKLQKRQVFFVIILNLIQALLQLVVYWLIFKYIEKELGSETVKLVAYETGALTAYLVCGIILLYLLISIINSYYIFKYSNQLGIDLSQETLRMYLSSSLLDKSHLETTRATSDIVVESNRITQNLFEPILLLPSSVFPGIIFLSASLIIGGVAIAIVCLVSGAIVFLLERLIVRDVNRRTLFLNEHTKIRSKSVRRIIEQTVNIRLNKSENVAHTLLAEKNTIWANNFVILRTQLSSYKLAIETIGFVSILILSGYYANGRQSEIFNLLLSLVLFFRSIPYLTSAMSNLTSIRANICSFQKLVEQVDIEETRAKLYQDQDQKTRCMLREYKLLSKGITLIKGPSGIGKSTLLLELAGLIHGKDLCINASMYRDLINYQRDIGFMGQNSTLIGNSVSENLKYIGDKSVPIETASKYLTKFELNFLSDGNSLQRLENLSGGELQRLNLLRLLLSDRNILMLDEPCSALDSKMAQIALNAIKDASLCKSVIVIAHDGLFDQSASQIWRL